MFPSSFFPELHGAHWVTLSWVLWPGSCCWCMSTWFRASVLAVWAKQLAGKAGKHALMVRRSQIYLMMMYLITLNNFIQWKQNKSSQTIVKEIPSSWSLGNERRLAAQTSMCLFRSKLHCDQWGLLPRKSYRIASFVAHWKESTTCPGRQVYGELSNLASLPQRLCIDCAHLPYSITETQN